jgi:hypothetical protein
MYLEHVFRALGLRAVDGEGVVCVVDGAPVGEGGFEDASTSQFLTRFCTRSGREPASWSFCFAGWT